MLEGGMREIFVGALQGVTAVVILYWLYSQ